MATYFVDTAGADPNSGLSALLPWATVAKVNATATASDRVRFKRAGVWRETLVAGVASATYDDYSTGALPEFNGCDDASAGWNVDLTPGPTVRLVDNFGPATDILFHNFCAFPVPSGVAVGNTILVSFTNNLASIIAPTCTDNKGNTYVHDTSLLNNNGLQTGIFRSIVTTALVAGDIITFHQASGSSRIGMSVTVWAGMLTASTPVDKVAQAVNTSNLAAVNSGNTATTTQADELLIGVTGINTQGSVMAVTPGSGWNELADLDIGPAGSQRHLHMQYKVATVTGAYNSTATLSFPKPWNAIIITYKSNGVAPGPIPGRYTKPAVGFVPRYMWYTVGAVDTHYELQSNYNAVISPGKWYFDGTNATAVFPSGVVPGTGNTINLSRRDQGILGANNVSGVTLRNLAVKFTNSISFMGAIEMYGGSAATYANLTIDGCLVEWSGSTGIHTGGGTFDIAGPVTVINSIVRDCRGHAMQLQFHIGALVANNQVLRCGRAGLGTVMRTSIIRNNEFGYTGNYSNVWGTDSIHIEGFDHGVYVVGDNFNFVMTFDNLVEGNISHHAAKACYGVDSDCYRTTFNRNIAHNGLQFAWYCEGGSFESGGDTRLYHNVAYKCVSGGIGIANSHSNATIKNNIINKCSQPTGWDIYIDNSILDWTLVPGTTVGVDATYTHSHMRQGVALLATALTGPLSAPGSSAAVGAGQHWYDSVNEKLYVRNPTSTAITQVWATPIVPHVIENNCFSTVDDMGTAAQSGILCLNPKVGVGGFFIYRTIATMQAGEPLWCRNNMAENPLFNNPDAFDFTLQDLSPCINAGQVIAGINDGSGGSNLYFSTAPDIGAFETDVGPVVIPPADVATVTVVPGAVSLQVGSTQQLDVTLKDGLGNVLTGRAITYTIDVSGNASVSSTGLVAGLVAGVATVTVSSEGINTNVIVTVTAVVVPTGPCSDIVFRNAAKLLTKGQVRSLVRELIDDTAAKLWSDSALDSLASATLDELWCELLDSFEWLTSASQDFPTCFGVVILGNHGQQIQRTYRIQKVVRGKQEYSLADPKDVAIGKTDPTSDSVINTISAPANTYTLIGNTLYVFPPETGPLTVWFSLLPTLFTSLAETGVVEWPDGHELAYVYDIASRAMERGDREASERFQKRADTSMYRLKNQLRKVGPGPIMPWMNSTPEEWGGA